MTYVRPLDRFVMTYTAFEPPHHPRIALAASSDLVSWERLGPLHFAREHGTADLNRHANKDGVLFCEPVQDPRGRPALALLYHGVSGAGTPLETHVRYCAGAAILDRNDPTKVLYRSPRPILEPESPQETQGVVPGVVFPTATAQRGEGHLDVYYGAADTALGVARLAIPPHVPLQDRR